jgi:hypothetical protein
VRKDFDGNEDWVKRGEGRIPSKGAQAAERASAGLGTSDDDGLLLGESSAPLTVWGKPAAKTRRPATGPDTP